jgi:4-amino-4-deoxy-L-arabinose transferase-like glycosyltransferase
MRYRPAMAVPIALALAQIALHLTLGLGYGVFRGELYYWDCANHPAWGYVDHPPLSIAVLAVWKAAFGDSMLSMRILPALAGGALILLTARLAGRLGGGTFARGLAAAIAFATPSYLGITGYYSMNSFELLFWVALAFIALDVIERGRRRDWVLLGLCVGLGTLNKISVLLAAAAAGVVILAATRLRALRKPGPYLAVGIAALVVAPHVAWQVQNGWPTREFVENAQRYKMTAQSPVDFLRGVLMEMGPLMAPWLVAGLVGLLAAPALRRGRPLGWMTLLALAVLTFSRSKPYYAVAAFPPVIAGLSVLIEVATAARHKWLRALPVAAAMADLALAAPFAIPMLPVDSFIAYQRALGTRPPSEERRDTGVLPQFLADRFGWPELAAQVAGAVRSLPPSDRAHCLIVADNYGEAAAINYYGRRYGLARAASQHNNYYLWGHGSGTPTAYVIVGDRRQALEQAFTEVREVARTGAPHAMPDETGVPIWICRGLRIPLDEAWRRGKHYI